MLRLGLALLVASCCLADVAGTARAQSESALDLTPPPIRGTTRRTAPPTPGTTAESPLPPPGDTLHGRPRTTGWVDPSTVPPPDRDAPLPPPSEGSSAPPWGESQTTGERTPLSPDDAIDARLDALDDHLSSLGARRSSGVGGGVVTMILGGTYIGLGVYANRNDEPTIARYFYISGIANVLNAGIGFGLQPNTERAYTRFTAIREDESLAPTERLRRSESILRSIARRRMASRFVQGGINLTVTAISLPFLFGSDGFEKTDAFDWIVTVSATISAVDAITTMVQRSEEERRWRMYRDFASRHGGDAVFTADARPRLRFRSIAVSPIPGGGYGGAAFIF